MFVLAIPISPIILPSGFSDAVYKIFHFPRRSDRILFMCVLEKKTFPRRTLFLVAHVRVFRELENLFVGQTGVFFVISDSILCTPTVQKRQVERSFANASISRLYVLNCMPAL